jgi:tetratricopeptide (TPR) repeat protein
LSLSASLAFLLISARPSGAAENRWNRLTSEHFEIYSSASPRSARDTLREFEQVRAFFLQVLGGIPGKPLPVRLVAFRSEKEYEPYRLNEFATAYYHPSAGRDYIVMSHSGAEIFPVAVHEYVHLLVRHSGLKLPPWLNEGMAELYSTLRPFGGKILVGDLIAGRYQALLREKWAPLATILAADASSPYYNEKSKAGSLYNEGWALTHMLCFRAEYRAGFGQLVKAISGGEDSTQALVRLYGPLSKIEKDLQAYLRGNSFQGALFAANIEKVSGEIPAEPLGDFDSGLMLADLINRPEKQAAYQAELERLMVMDPQRPEPYRELGYLAWRTSRRDEALRQFGKAFERGDRDATMLWDYGRLLEAGHGDEAMRVLSQLLSQDAGRMDVRLELADAQLRARQPTAALQTLAAVSTVTRVDAPRYFRIAVYAHLNNHDPKSAETVAKHALEQAKGDEDRAAAEQLMKLATQANASSVVREAQLPPEPSDTGRPALRRREAGPGQSEPPGPQASSLASASGRFVELDCRKEGTRLIVDTGEGKKAFLLRDPNTIVINAGSGGPVDLTCGVQKTPAKVAVGYEAPPADQAGVSGVVRTLAF